MNNLKKIGLTALGTTLIASSAFAADMSVTGGASLSYDQTSDKVGGSSVYMGDSINFRASGEMDNGMTVAVHYEIDGGALDDHSFTLGTADMGSLTFDGSGGGSSLSSMDDVTPNAYEESWDIVAGTPTIINGMSGTNSMKYTSADLNGAVVTLAYVNDQNYVDFGITMTPEMVEGLTIGYARGETQVRSAAAPVDITEYTAYAKYVVGSVTLGYQISDADSPTAGDSLESKAMGVSYAVSENLSLAYNTHKLDKENNSNEQKASGISASYTMGSMTLGGAKNKVDNVANTAGTDVEGYEFTLGFAF
jgi:outer membrane protein OmpU